MRSPKVGDIVTYANPRGRTRIDPVWCIGHKGRIVLVVKNSIHVEWLSGDYQGETLRYLYVDRGLIQWFIVDAPRVLTEEQQDQREKKLMALYAKGDDKSIARAQKYESK